MRTGRKATGLSIISPNIPLSPCGREGQGEGERNQASRVAEVTIIYGLLPFQQSGFFIYGGVIFYSCIAQSMIISLPFKGRERVGMGLFLISIYNLGDLLNARLTKSPFSIFMAASYRWLEFTDVDLTPKGGFTVIAGGSLVQPSTLPASLDYGGFMLRGGVGC